MKTKDNKGITLIALVITIIVLLILAGVTIATLIGDNGILTRASDAKEETEIAEEEEAIRLAYSGVLTDNNVTGVSAGELQNELRNNGYTNAEVIDNGDGTYTVKFESGRSYIIEENGNITESTTGGITPPVTIGKTDGSYDETKGVNTPKLGANMELVVYEDGEWVTDETNAAYSYVAQTGTTEDGGTSEWANAKVTIDGIESYFVWIPRYAYKIDSENQTIDVKFLKDTGVEATDETICKYADDNTLDTSTDYIIHPAFTTNADLGGGWDTELAGLWIAKYEAARSDSEGETQGTSTIIKIQPNVASFRSTSIDNMYNYALNYSTDLQSHMSKNSEWGAVAYLTHSQYGRNGTEVAINNSVDCITGSSGGSANASSKDTVYQYNDMTKGILASSTGNVYGIYDLSGGIYEYVAGYYSESSLSLTNGPSFADGTSDKYATAYTGTEASSAYKYGDATYETNGWNGDDADFVDEERPFFGRGNYWSVGSRAGIFSFNRLSGYGFNYNGSYSVRVCLVVQ